MAGECKLVSMKMQASAVQYILLRVMCYFENLQSAGFDATSMVTIHWLHALEDIMRLNQQPSIQNQISKINVDGSSPWGSCI